MNTIRTVTARKGQYVMMKKKLETEDGKKKEDPHSGNTFELTLIFMQIDGIEGLHIALYEVSPC